MWLELSVVTALATTAGAVLGSQPLWAPVLVLVWLAVLAARRWIALASMSAALSLLVVALVRGEDRLWAGALTLVVLVRHRANVVTALALRRGDEPDQ